MSNNGPVTYEYGELFYLKGIEWRTTSTTANFIIATRADVEGEPQSHTDMIQVIKP